jgi:hypothetical protein
LAFVRPESAGSRVKILRLTPKGRIAQDAYHRLILDVEQRWQARFGKDVVRSLRESIERLDGDATAHRSGAGGENESRRGSSLQSLRGGHLYSSPVKNCAILRNFA